MSSVSKTFRELRQVGSLCDVVITVNDVEFKAHRIILCNCSLYFRNLFCSEPSIRAFSFLYVSPNIMSLLLEYAYTCSVVVTQENVRELLAAAGRFDVKGVLKACFDFLEQKLCVKNCVSVWMSASLHNCPDLKQKTNLYILHHFEEVAGSSVEFLQLSVQQLADFIEKDELNVKQESTVFEAILRWIEYAPEARRGHMAVLLSKVRLSEMSSDYLFSTVSRNNLVLMNSLCLDMVTNAVETLNESNMGIPLTSTRLPYAVLLVIGVWAKDYPTESIEIYNVRADQWRRLTISEEAPRMFYGSVYLKGFIYFIGGLDEQDFLSSVRKLNLVTRSWEEVGPMHIARCYASAVVLNGCIYAIGGCGAHEYHDDSDTVERYDPDANQWTLIASMHHRRTNFNATTLHGKIYVYGGYDRGDRLSSAECYNPHTNQWTLIAPMETALNGVAVIAYNDLIYVAGGFDGIRAVNSVAAYDPLSDSWCSMAPMLNSRNYFSVTVLEDLLYVFGGLPRTFGNMECYDGKTNTWKSVQHLSVASRTPSCYVVERIPYFSAYPA